MMEQGYELGPSGSRVYGPNYPSRTRLSFEQRMSRRLLLLLADFSQKLLWSYLQR